jgi:hypothetical protein
MFLQDQTLYSNLKFRAQSLKYEFDAEFDVGSLLQFHVLAEIANVTKQGVTNTRVVQLPMSTQRSRLAH